MKAEAMNLLQWQALFGTEEKCAEVLKQHRWLNGFQFPQCGHDQGHCVASRKVYQCYHCRRQIFMTPVTLFHSSNLPLMQWFLAIYLMVCDKGGLSKQTGFSWITVHWMLRKMRHAMADRDSIFRLGGLVGLDDAFVGRHRSVGRSGRSSEGKTPILIATEFRDKKAGFMAMETIPSLITGNIRQVFQRHLLTWQTARTNGLMALRVRGETQHHKGRVTPQVQVAESLPGVRIAIGNLKVFLLRTYHGVTGKYLQEHLNEFDYRLNLRVWKTELPSRLLNACIDRTPVRLVAERC